MLTRDRGLREGGTQGVEGRVLPCSPSATARSCGDAYTTHAEALEAVGLSEQDAHADS